MNGLGLAITAKQIKTTQEAGGSLYANRTNCGPGGSGEFAPEFAHLNADVLFGVKYWNGAVADSWFSHLAIEVPGEQGSNEWLKAVDDLAYGK